MIESSLLTCKEVSFDKDIVFKCSINWPLFVPIYKFHTLLNLLYVYTMVYTIYLSTWLHVSIFG